MRWLKLLVTIFFLLPRIVVAQEENLEVFEINADTATTIKIPDHNWQYLIEKEKLSLDEVRSNKHVSGFKKINYENAPLATYWMRYKVKNNLRKDLAITISGDISSQIYISLNGKWSVYRNGDNIPWSERDGLKKLRHIVYTIPANDTIIIYKRSENLPGIAIKNNIGIKDNIIQKYYVENDNYYFGTVTNSFLFGFLAFAAICNFFFFFISRERIYFIYALTLLVTSLYFFIDSLYNVAFREHPIAFYAMQTIIFGLYTFMVFLTILLFLKVDVHHKVWHKILLAGAGILAVFSIINSIWWTHDSFVKYQQIFGNGTRLMVVFILISIVIIIGVDIYKKRSTARIFMIAITPLLVSSAIPFILIGNTPSWMPKIILTSVVWAVVVMSWSLFDRFKGVLQENMQQALDKERLAREKEEERNELIAQQNENLEKQVSERTAELTKSLENLKLTQNQLIQAEKMASLGELTAGIAHEIQNPLNFVNNFSDVSAELLEELKEELANGEIDEATALADDITQNLGKISHHGRRADSIVKGMLQHSRASTGQKEPTDINALADEYLRLAYHGLRAKDKSFNAELITDFSPALPKANILSQDIGRVLLNLFTNAFYATQQKSKQQDSYKPTVSVITSQAGDFVEIIVRDNGTGIPDNIRDKILQPFFTTKPTGEGTGLGLSLSYDIVVKAHGGTIDIESVEGEGALFKITLPIAL